MPRLRKGLHFGDQPDVHAYDHIDLPEIKPVVTRVNIHSGHCPCCGKRIAGASLQASPAPMINADELPGGRGLKQLLRL